MKPVNKQNRFILLFVLLLCLSAVPGTTASNTGLEIKCSPGEVSVFQGEKVVLNVEVTNHLFQSIRPGTNHFISYHLYDEKGESISYNNRRFRIPRVLRRKKITTFTLPVFFDYPQSGNYTAEFDIVKEGAFWGSAKKWKTCKIKLHLKSLFSREFKEKYLTYFCPTGNPLLDNEQYLLRMTLKNSEILKFCEKTGKKEIFGFSPGSTYPQVWIRDTATFTRYAALYYPFDTLTKTLELFMEHQGVGGEIADWVDISGKTDKNTVETDQESSLVLAAYEMGMKNPGWFHKKIKGKTVLSRLEMALEWVWKNKRDPGYNLVYSGFTADWGDTENTFPDQRATKLSARSTLVFSIYTQAKYIQAIGCLIEIFKRQQAGQTRVQRWQQRLDILKRQTMKHLYLKDKGYFLIHLVPTAEKETYFQMEKEMLAVGGNAEAIIAGLMDRVHVGRFLQELEKRRKEYKLRTVSFTLIPPYPEGFFPHHLLKRPWNYQNGGEWDWIGARVVKALFMSGFREEAQKYLLEIVKKNLANYCIFEWEDRNGSSTGGAMFYVGAAGLLGDAVLMGCRSRQTANPAK